MNDELPVELDGEDELTEEDGEWGIWEWSLAAGGTVGAIFVLSWVFSFLAWLAGYALYAGIAAIVLYAGYKGIEALLGDETAGERATSVPEHRIQGELDDLSAESELDSELENLDELDSASGDEVVLDDVSEQDLEADVDASTDLEDDELERKFAELEREMSED